MERAPILGKLAFSFPRDILVVFKSMSGVTDANLIYGPYDFYVTANAKTKEALSELVLKIRSTKGVADIITCYVISLSELKPEPRSHLAE